MMAAQCGDSLSRPAISPPGKTTITVQDAGNEIITADTSQNRNGFDQLARCLHAALAATPARQAQFYVRSVRVQHLPLRTCTNSPISWRLFGPIHHECAIEETHRTHADRRNPR